MNRAFFFLVPFFDPFFPCYHTNQETIEKKMMQKKSIVTIGGAVVILGSLVLAFAFYRATILDCK